MNRFATALAACLASAAAMAADLPSRYAPAPYYEPAPIFAWTGLYAGIHGTFGVGSFTHAGNAAFGNPLGGLGGATVGYNYQSGNLLVGAEGDIGFGSLSDSGSFGYGTFGSGRINTLGTARVRFGYVMNRSMLLYVTGGYAGTSLQGGIADFGASPNLLVTESHYLNGFAVGAGLEYALTTRISVKGEYLFTDFASTRYFVGTRDSLGSGANLNLIRAGLNYHF